ncbi:hypothetical protein [Halorubrum sp. BOL3-1]|uniref:hypothetical protein n=1 Tax=Halorubrum sp. BOL3-1 TaxID=2497325 RepID=UPI00140C2E13|nr:hypothetical protein [Halorubrum sp. BOL3-1]
MAPDEEELVVVKEGEMLPDEREVIAERIELLEEADEGDFLTVDEVATELEIDLDS